MTTARQRQLDGWAQSPAGRRAAAAHRERMAALAADLRRQAIDDKTQARWPGWDDSSSWNDAEGLERARTAALWRRARLEEDTTP